MSFSPFSTSSRLENGHAAPLGAHWDGNGVNFALFSAHAEEVELCLFDDVAANEIARLTLPAYTDGVWHGYLAGAHPGLVYGYRVYGRYDPAHGHRFNPHKLLIDPYARAFAGHFKWSAVHYGDRDGEPDDRDNAATMLKCRIVDPAFDWEDDQPPRTPWSESVIYEAHVKGYTMSDLNVPSHLRGTYAAFAHPAAIAHLKQLGVTAVELLPVHEFLDEQILIQRGLVNYWGYNTLGYFAPAARYALGDPRLEFRALVKSLHAAGIEVILDVVYNHTCEGDNRGPTLAFRGIDNASYYRLDSGNLSRYADVTGCGNTLNFSHPRVTQMALDSMRYWVAEMHVDGFRFDLATALARGNWNFDAAAPFLESVRRDPLLSRIKLIAEPWDTMTYEVGRFPSEFSEWNDKFRDAARGFWLTKEVGCSELAKRLTASGDLFRRPQREPRASINFVTAHDGFTLTDLVSYQHKHNEANDQSNCDGADRNYSINCGVEGPTHDPGIDAMRVRLQRALLTTLFISQGVPMLLAGDEQRRTQHGNNNAYCQDTPLSWLNWSATDTALFDFTQRLIKLRRDTPALRQTRWFDGTKTALGETDIVWLSPRGTEMTADDWHDGSNYCFGFRVGRVADSESAILVLINGAATGVEFILPQAPDGGWTVLIDSANPDVSASVIAREAVLPPQAIWVLKSTSKR